MKTDTRNTYFSDFSLYSGPLAQLPRTNKLIINTINQYSYCVACRDKDFKEALIRSGVLLPDGIAMVAAEKLLNKKKIKKISGSDLHQYFLKKLNKEKGSCFYLGSSTQTLKKIKLKLSYDFPNVSVNFYSPPFKKNFSEIDSKKMVEAVNHCKPDVLFIGMTAPKQEKWVYQNKNYLDAKVICSIGAVFDFYSGSMKRPGRVWREFGLEWFIRLVKEPKRMWKRYLYYGPIFLKYMISDFIRNVQVEKTETIRN